MVKIFYYELRRLLGNRFTVGLLLVALLYGYWTMRGEILLGIANTAPFSPWSFGAYLAEMMPLLLVALLCFLSILTSDTCLLYTSVCAALLHGWLYVPPV